MSKKMSLNDLYTASRRLIDFGKEICKSPTKIHPPHYCTKCGTELHSVYMEDRVYLVACPKCELSVLVEAVSPMNALMKVGNFDDTNWPPLSVGWPEYGGKQGGRMTLKEAYAAYLADWKKRQALMDELDEDGYMPMSCQWEDILKAMRDRQEKELEDGR